MANSGGRIAKFTILVPTAFALMALCLGTFAQALGDVEGDETAQRARQSVTVVQTEISSLTSGQKLGIGESVETGAGRMKLLFPEGSEVTLFANSVLRLREIKILAPVSGETANYRSIVLELIKGQARVRVLRQSEDSIFEIRTRTSVINWQSGESVVNFDPAEAPWRTEVKTLSGVAILEADGREPSDKTRVAEVAAGANLAYVVEAQPPGAIAYEIDAAIHRGFMSPLKRLSSAELKTLDQLTVWPAKAAVAKKTAGAPKAFAKKAMPAPASERTVICRAPAGDFNQCSWTCEGNPKGAKSCRTDLRGVQCVRRLCRANGQWADATVLPAGHARECGRGQSPVIGTCGGYW